MSYDISFKKKAIKMLSKLKNEGKIIAGTTRIRNVRELAKFLEISTYSLYKWKKEFAAEEQGEEEETGESLIEESDCEKAKFGIRFFSWLAKELEIDGWYDLSLRSLKLRIGNALIKDAKGDSQNVGKK